MNLIINLVGIECDKQLEKFALKVEDKTILEKVIAQVSTSTVNNLIFIVKEQFVEQLKDDVEVLKKKCNISFKVLKSNDDVEIAQELLLSDLMQTYNCFHSIDLNSFFNQSLDLKQDTVLLDGMKLYKRDIFNFEKCTSNTYVKFVSKDSTIDSNYMLYLHNSKAAYEEEIKKIVVKDYKYNYIMLDNLKSLIESSNAFTENKKLRYEYIKQLFSEFKFDEALYEVEKYSNQDGYWSMFYLELLEGFGQELKFVNYYKHNKKRLENFEFTKTQEEMYCNITALFEAINTEQPLVNVDIKEYLREGNTDFRFIIDSINSSKSKSLNISYLLQNLIIYEQLSSQQAIELLEIIVSLNTSPYIRQKLILDIFDYFIDNKQILNMQQKLLNSLISAMHKNSELFEKGLNEKAKQLTKIMDLKTREGSKLIVSKNAETQTSSKVAVCISGVAKFNFEKNLELINSFVSKNLDVDYFVQMWDKYEEYPALSEKGKNPDFDWAKYYANRFKKLQPTYITRQANFEALLPKTSNVLFTKQFNDIKSEQYTKYLGDKVKGLKKFNYDVFTNKIKLDENMYSDLNNKMIKYFERNKVGKLLEEYVKTTNKEYEYVINIDINTVLRSPIYLEDLSKIDELTVYVHGDEENNQFASCMTIAKYETARYVNKLWELCKRYKNASPYILKDQEILEQEQDPMLLHIIAGGINVRTNTSNYGDPYINKKIKLPLIADEVEADISELGENRAEIKKYFTEMEKTLSRVYADNTKYQLIKQVKLINSKITDNGIVIELSITGESLKKLLPERFHLAGKSKLNLDSSSDSPKLYKQQFEFLKHDDNEIVVRKEVLDKELFAGKEWSFTVLFHDMTLSNFKIEYDLNKAKYELSKYGMKFIKYNDEFTIGITTKSYLLNN